MKITLKKAGTIQAALNNLVGSVYVDNKVQILEFDDVEQKLGKAKTEFLGNLQDFEKNVEVLYSIRDKISVMNFKGGIDAVLTKLAMFDRKIAAYRQINTSQSGVASDIDTVRSMMDKLSKRETQGNTLSYKNTYEQFNSVIASVLTEDEIESYKEKVKDLLLEKQQLQDELAKLNMTKTIELSVDEVACLKELKLI